MKNKLGSDFFYVADKALVRKAVLYADRSENLFLVAHVLYRFCASLKTAIFLFEFHSAQPILMYTS